MVAGTRPKEFDWYYAQCKTCNFSEPNFGEAHLEYSLAFSGALNNREVHTESDGDNTNGDGGNTDTEDDNIDSEIDITDSDYDENDSSVSFMDAHADFSWVDKRFALFYLNAKGLEHTGSDAFKSTNRTEFMVSFGDNFYVRFRRDGSQ